MLENTEGKISRLMNLKNSFKRSKKVLTIIGNFNSKRALLTLIQIPCHHVLAKEISLNLKYRISLNINLGIGIIKKTTFFVRIFDISSCVFTQISIGRARWMWN